MAFNTELLQRESNFITLRITDKRKRRNIVRVSANSIKNNLIL